MLYLIIKKTGNIRILDRGLALRSLQFRFLVGMFAFLSFETWFNG